jgi:2-octaprenyl-6-methoxyphenol hydroxylase
MAQDFHGETKLQGLANRGLNTKHIIVVGGGPAGLAAAALMAQEGLRITLIAPEPRPDQRTTALMQPSLRMLGYVGVWPNDLEQHCAALKHLKLIDDTGNTVSAPDITFSASELNLDCFGWNVPVASLVPTLLQRCNTLGVAHITSTATNATMDATSVTVTCSNGQSAARLPLPQMVRSRYCARRRELIQVIGRITNQR